MRAFAFFVQLLFWLLLIRLLLRLLGRFFRATPSPQPAPQPARRSAQVEDLVQDPVCHTHFPRSRAVVGRIGGRDELFCSAACRDAALAQARRAAEPAR